MVGCRFRDSKSDRSLTHRLRQDLSGTQIQSEWTADALEMVQMKLLAVLGASDVEDMLL